jgi:hypothetical protein
VGGVGEGVPSRVTTTEAWPVPKALVQLAAIGFVPIARFTRFALVLIASDAPTLHVVPGGIAELPFTVKATTVDEDVVVDPFSGPVIATDGSSPRVTLADALLSPKALEHATSIEFRPADSETALTVALVVPALFTVQVVPDGMAELPLTVKDTLTAVEEVDAPELGATIATEGMFPRAIPKLALPTPYAFVQLTVIVLLPSASEYGLV